MPEITSSTVPEAWLGALSLATSSPGREARNLIVNIECFDAFQEVDDELFRAKLDEKLTARHKYTVSTVANTIFPESLWVPREPRAKFFERYLRLWSRIAANRDNRRGTYFQRLIAYPNLDKSQAHFNQLDHVITAYKRGIRRRSTFQCGILAPWLDLNPTPYQGFPCMHQVAFMPKNGRLRVVALYPTHYLCARAYGNYLGLLRLGHFMAHEMALQLEGLTCIALVGAIDLADVASSMLSEVQ